MVISAYENWARFKDNGIWEYPHRFTTSLFTDVWQGARAKIIDDVIYIIRKDGPAYKIDLNDYTESQQAKIIDNLFTILE